MFYFILCLRTEIQILASPLLTYYRGCFQVGTLVNPLDAGWEIVYAPAAAADDIMK